MSLIPNTTCQRCHRQYPAFRNRCPHCGMKKEETAQRVVPETDSAVKGSDAARRAADNVNWQMLIGGILLVCILVAVIALVSVNVKKDVGEAVPEMTQQDMDAIAPTSVPTPTVEPSPSPTPPPAITALMITFNNTELTDFTEPVGSELQLTATPYPLGIEVDVIWSSDNEAVATISEDGLLTIVGPGVCTIEAQAGGTRTTCICRGRE